MNKLGDFFTSPNVQKATNALLVLLVLAILVMAIYIMVKKNSEHYAPEPACMTAMQAYNAYKCKGDQITKLTGKNEMMLLKDIIDNCPEGSTLGSYACGPMSADVDILGGTQVGNRTPNFFPGPRWDRSIRGSNRTQYGLYSYN